MIDKVAALRRTVLFGGLEDTHLAALAERSIERPLARGEILFGAGEEVKGLYVVTAGALRAFRIGPDGREQVIHVEREGATIAEVPVFDDGPTPSTVAADIDSVVLFIDKRDVRHLCLQHPAIALSALELLARRLRGCSDLVAMISLPDVGQRVAKFLLAEAAAHGTRDGRAIAFDLTLTKEQIAARVGTVREVVSRALGRFQQEGHILIDGRRVTIVDEAELRAYIGDA